ncbi:MAG: histidine phosphatase family protein [Pseudomonadota bacterium]
MSHITLVRHGQANSTATDELSYDRLSPLGHEQSGWLGVYLRDTAAHHTRLYTGTLRRHIETAAAMNTGLEPVRDARLNELEYFTLAHLLEAQHGVAFPKDQSDVADHMLSLFGHWRAGQLKDAPETWEHFQHRVNDALDDIAAGKGPALVITSGGLISMAMAQRMDLDTPAMARLALAIMHTSMHRFFPIGGHLSPVLFNAVPHLDRPDRRAAQTHI